MPLTIENKTPWDTEELTRFLTFLCEGTPIDTVEVILNRARPGTKREDQQLFAVSGINFYDIQQNGTVPTHVVVKVISPKRSAARADLLDRLSQAGDIATHETVLHPKIVGGIAHAFGKIKNLCNQLRAGHSVIDDTWEYRRHYEGTCDCNRDLSAYPTIRGNTKVRTSPPVDIDRLRRRLRWALEAADKWREKMEERIKAAEKLRKRIEKAEAKAWEAKGSSR